MDSKYLTTNKIAEARAKKLWLVWANDPSIRFTPSELERAQAEGRFCHGENNFKLVDPADILVGLKEKITRLQDEYDNVFKRVEQG